MQISYPCMVLQSGFQICGYKLSGKQSSSTVWHRVIFQASQDMITHSFHIRPAPPREGGRLENICMVFFLNFVFPLHLTFRRRCSKRLKNTPHTPFRHSGRSAKPALGLPSAGEEKNKVVYRNRGKRKARKLWQQTRTSWPGPGTPEATSDA